MFISEWDNEQIEFVELFESLDEELCRRGAVAVHNEEANGKWVGVDTDAGNWKVVWPPMVKSCVAANGDCSEYDA